MVVSCATSTDAPQATSGRNPSVAADVNLERVVLQAYRAIGDRHLFEPNFRALSTETYRGFAGADPAHGRWRPPTASSPSSATAAKC